MKYAWRSLRGIRERAARPEAMLARADSSTTLNVLPGEVLDRLGVPWLRGVSLVLAHGRLAQRDVGEAAVAVNGDSVPCRVVFGEPGVAVLLGLTAHEQLGPAVGPEQRRLVPADFLLNARRATPFR